MGEIKSFRDLVVWRRAMELIEEVYRLCRLLPKTEEYRLTSQLTRAAVSVAANIAEGHERATRRDYAHFISIARGSLAEVETYLILIARLNFVTEQQASKAAGLAGEVGRMLNSLHHRLQQP